MGEQYLSAGPIFDMELANFREALGWCLTGDPADFSAGDEIQLGARLCLTLYPFWELRNYFTELEMWLHRALERLGGRDSRELSGTLEALASCAFLKGDETLARKFLTDAKDMRVRLNDTNTLYLSLFLAHIEWTTGSLDKARAVLQEALDTVRQSARAPTTESLDEDPENVLMYLLSQYAHIESLEGNHTMAKEMLDEALQLARKRNSPVMILGLEHSFAHIQLMMGQTQEAADHMQRSIPRVLQLNDPGFIISFAEDYSAALAELGDHELAVLLLGAAEATRERLAIFRNPNAEPAVAEIRSKTQSALSSKDWNTIYQSGRDTRVEDVLTSAAATAATTP
jgi:tetratricopeptide (TPR) repeat protein